MLDCFRNSAGSNHYDGTQYACQCESIFQHSSQFLFCLRTPKAIGANNKELWHPFHRYGAEPEGFPTGPLRSNGLRPNRQCSCLIYVCNGVEWSQASLRQPPLSFLCGVSARMQSVPHVLATA